MHRQSGPVRPGLLIALLAAVIVAIGSASAQGKPSDPVQLHNIVPGPVLVIKKLRDAGGLIAPEKGKLPLNEHLTTGLVKYLEDRANGLFTVWDARRREPWKRQESQPALILEGDLSRTAGVTLEKDVYLLTVRLFHEGSARQIAAQWSGSARSLLYLTNNLKRDPRFSSDGLLGEIGDRIVQTTTAFATPSREEQAKTFVKLAAPIASSKDLVATVLPDVANLVKRIDGSAAGLKDGVELVSGMPFTVQVASGTAGSIYVVMLSENGDVRPLLVAEAGKETLIEPAKPLSLPEQGSWKARETKQPLQQELLVLLRRPAEPVRKNGSPAQSSAVPGVENAGPFPGLGVDPEPDVQVVNAGNSLLPRNSADPDLARLSALVTADPARWRIARVKLSILPGKKE